MFHSRIIIHMHMCYRTGRHDGGGGGGGRTALKGRDHHAIHWDGKSEVGS